MTVYGNMALFFGTAASALGADYEHCCAFYEDWPLVWMLS